MNVRSETPFTPYQAEASRMCWSRCTTLVFAAVMFVIFRRTDMWKVNLQIPDKGFRAPVVVPRQCS